MVSEANKGPRHDPMMPLMMLVTSPPVGLWVSLGRVRFGAMQVETGVHHLPRDDGRDELPGRPMVAVLPRASVGSRSVVSTWSPPQTP